MFILSGKFIDLELVFETEKAAEEQLKKWEAEDIEEFGGSPDNDEYYISELTAKDAENLVIYNNYWNEKFSAWLAENGKQPHEWDYSDLGDFFREKGH